MQFCNVCESITIDGQCSNKRCKSKNEKLCRWLINGKLERFRRPVTFAEAQEAVKGKSEIVYKPKPPSNEFIKMPTW